MEAFGRYRIEKLIGQGGMGKVYLAYDLQLKRHVALKTSLGVGASSQRRFLKEASAMARLSHPNVVRIHDVGKEGEAHYFTMDFIEGRSLAALVKEARPTPKKAAELLQKTALGIGHAHDQGVLHRDIKPQNIIVTPDGEPIVMDFGLALEVEGATKVSKSGAIVGTPSYMSPEQALGKRREMDERSDVYSLGAVLYEMLAGVPPFRGPNSFAILNQLISKAPKPPSRLSPKVPGELERICLKALQKDPDLRYQSARQMAQDFERFLAGDPVLAGAPGPVYVTAKWLTKNRFYVAAAALALSAAIVFGGYSLAQANRSLALEKTQRARIAQANVEIQAAREKISASLALSWLRYADIQRWSGNREIAALVYAQVIANAEKEGIPEKSMRPTRMGLAWQLYDMWKFQRRLEGHAGEIMALDISPALDRFVASASADGSARLWDIGKGESTVVVQESETMHAVKFSPDGGILAAAGEGGVIHLWRVDSGQPVAELRGHEGAVFALAFSPDGTTLVSGGRDAIVGIWNLRARSRTKSWGISPPTWVRAVAFSPGGIWLACAGNDGIIHLQDCKRQEWTRELRGHTGLVKGLFFIGEAALASCGHDQTIRLWNAATGGTLAVMRGHMDRVESIAYAPQILDRILQAPQGSYREGSSGETGTLVSIGVDLAARVWENGAVCDTIPTEGANALAINRSGDLLALAGRNRIEVRRREDVSCRKLIHPTPINAIALSPDGLTLACGQRNRNTVLWDLRTLACKGELRNAEPRWCNQLAFSGDGKLLALSFGDGIQVWDAESLRMTASAKVSNATWNPIAFGPSGKRLAYTEGEETILWLLGTPESRRTLPKAQGDVLAISFSPDERLLAVADETGRISICDIETGVVRSVLKEEDRVPALAFAPSGKVLASFCRSGGVSLWNIAGGERVSRLDHRFDAATSVAFSPNGETLAVGEKEALALADVESGRVYHRFRIPLARVTAVAFSPDGRDIYAGCTDRALRIYSTPKADFLSMRGEDVARCVESSVTPGAHSGLPEKE